LSYRSLEQPNALAIIGDAERCPLHRLVLWRGGSENGPLGGAVSGALLVSFTASVQVLHCYNAAETKNR